VLERHCKAVGRDPGTIIKTRLGGLVIGKTQGDAERIFKTVSSQRGMDAAQLRAMYVAGDPDSVAEQVQRYLDAGLDGMIFNLPYAEDEEHIDLAGRTLARLGQPAPAGR